MKECVLVAKCLNGCPCRYHGRPTPPRRKLLERLNRRYEVIYICPEQMGGLSTPRPPARWQGDRLMADGQNVIGAFTLGACKTLRIAESHKAVKFYGLRHSPSCDPRTGITAQMLRKRGIVCHFG